MKIKILVSSLAMAAIATCAFAQDGQGGPPPGGPQGGFGGPGGPGGRGPGMGGPRGALQPMERLLMRSDVQADLNLADDQKSKLSELQQSMRSQMRPPSPNGGSQDQSSQRQAFEKMREQMKAAVEKILTPEQVKRVKEIAIQLAGNRAVLDPQVQKSLNLTTDQTTKIKSLMQAQREANDSIRQKIENGELDRQSARASMQKNQKSLDSALAAILTDDQKSQLKTMGGAHFEATVQDDGPGGPGGPRGFGGPGGGGPGGGGPGGPGGGPGDGGPGGPPPGDGGPGGPPPGGGE